MSRLNEITVANSECIQIFGGSGAGKSFQLSTLGNRQLILTDGNGIKTFQNIQTNNPEFNPIIELVAFDKSIQTDHVKAFDSMRNIIINYTDNPKLRAEIDFICIDDMTFLSDQARNKALNMNATVGRSKTQELAMTPKFGKDFLMTMSDFGTQMGLMSEFVYRLCQVGRQYNIDIVVCSHERYIYKETDKGEDVLSEIVPFYIGRDSPKLNSRNFDANIHILREAVNDKLSRTTFRFAPSSRYPICSNRYGSEFATTESGITLRQIVDRMKKATKTPHTEEL